MKKKIFMILMPLAICLVVVAGVFFKIDTFSVIPYENITKAEFEKKIQNDEDMYVYAYKPSCVACNAFKSIIAEAMEEVDITLYGLNVTDNPNISFLKEHDIQEVPVMRKYVDGEVKKNSIGVLSKDELIEFLK